MLKGIDVSTHNGVIDWNAVRRAGIAFAIIRAGYGKAADSRFAANISGALKAGITAGVYWFSYALNAGDAEKEADVCRETVKAFPLKLPVYYDYEYDSERYASEKDAVCTVGSRTAIIKAFCGRIGKYGYTAGIYANPDYIRSRVDYGALSSYPLWLARWPSNDATSFGNVSELRVDTAYKPAVWQFGYGSVNGVPTDVDLDYGYFALPAAAAQSETAAQTSAVKKGDCVRVINTTISGKRVRGRTYDGKSFAVWYGTYNVISVSGDRAVIGKDSVITAAVNVGDLQKL